MGNICQCCTSHDEGSPQASPIPMNESRPALMGSSHDEGPSLPLSSPQPPIISSSPPSVNTASSSSLSIESLQLSIQQVDPDDQIEPLITFIDYQLQRIKGSSEEASSSSLLTSVTSTTNLAAKFIDTISKEAESLASTDIAKEMGSLALSGLKKVGEAHWIFLGLSVAASALERCVTVRSNASDCIDLLQAIVFLAKDLKRFKEAMPGESERLCGAVQIIVEGAIMCSDYITKGRFSRYWSAVTTQAQLGKTNESLKVIRSSLSFPLHLELARNATKRFEESPLRLLEFEPVGIEEKVEKVKALLDMEGTDPARVVVLCGFGGVGKSTLAASVIQNLYQTQSNTCAGFKFCRVIINDKTADEISHVKELQQHIIFDFGGGKSSLRNPEEGRVRLQDVMERKSCLLFIDNVVDKKYVQLLLPKDLLWFKKSENMSRENLGKPKTKLRILITSREKNLKSEFNIPFEEDDVNVLSNDTSRCFLRKIILQTHDEYQCCDNFEDTFINDVADACRGVPILLSIFGKYLKDHRKPPSYKEALQALHHGKLNSFADEDLSNQLFFVYSKLEEEDQEAFLDICIYFYGWEWSLVSKILDEGRLEALQRKILINKSETGVVIVHDILRLLGKKEARQTRISNFIELKEILKNDEENMKNVKGISIVRNDSLVTVESKHLNTTWKSLRVLMIGDRIKLNGPPCDRAFKKLRYLSLGDTIDFPFKDASKLDGLQAFFNRSKDGMNLHKLPPNLKIIFHHVPDLYTHSFETLPLQKLSSLQSFIVETKKLVKLPEEFGFPLSLVDLQLKYCEQLPKDIGNLANLERLILDECDLKCLPQGMGELKKLKHLSMQSSTKLASLPEALGRLSSLTSLRLCGCTLLQNLPEDLGKLTALEKLNMRDCESLRELPGGFGSLSSLQKLDLSGCVSLKTLPESFGELRIESLTLQSLLSLESLPSCFGNMPCLSLLELISCNSLSALPNTFVNLKCLKTLEIRDCINLVAPPGDFSQLSSLSKMIVNNYPKLQELPQGFQALLALKHLHLRSCSSLENLPSGFGELISLEFLWLEGLFISRLPDGFGNLKRLKGLLIEVCLKLETLSDDFETLPSLTHVKFDLCPKLDGAAMERVRNLQQCYYVFIRDSDKLRERWEEIREEDDSPMVVVTGSHMLTGKDIVDDEDWNHAARVGLLCGNCVEWDNTRQELIGCSTSMLFEEDTTVALITLPLHVEFHRLQRFVYEVIEKAKTVSTRRLRIVYVRRVKEKGETTGQEKKEEEDYFGEILKSRQEAPSSAIPSTDRRRHRLIHKVVSLCQGCGADNKLACSLVNVGVDDKNHKFVKFKTSFGEDDISGGSIQSSESSYNGLGDFIESICSGKSSGTAGFADFIQKLKKNKVDHLIDSKLNQVQFDQLKSNVVGIFVSDLNTLEYIQIEQVYKQVKSEGHSFEMIWIPLLKSECYGLGTYTRAIQQMSWTVLPHPNVVKLESKNPHCIIFDQEGKMTNQDALFAMMSWGVKFFPFSKREIPQTIFSTVWPGLSFLFNKLNPVNEDKLFFLYAEPPTQELKMKFNLEKLTHFYSKVQILYVGYPFLNECDFTTFKKVYEDVIQKMHWSKLSFEEMVAFWYRCKYLMDEVKDLNSFLKGTFGRLVKHLCIEKRWLLLLDSGGLVTRSGYDVMEKLFKPNNEKIDEVDNMMEKELKVSFQQEQCNQVVREFFKDEITCHPLHHQHPLLIQDLQMDANYPYLCCICGDKKYIKWDQQRVYRCKKCNWGICTNCWELFVKEKVRSYLLKRKRTP